MQASYALFNYFDVFVEARSRLSHSQDSEPADKVPTTHNSVPHFPGLDSASPEQKFLSVPNYTVAQFPNSPAPFTSSPSIFSTSAPISTSFQSFQAPDSPHPFTVQPTSKTESGKLNPYPFTPPVGLALQPTELTNVTFNSQVTPSVFRFDTPSFPPPDSKFGSFRDPSPSTSTTSTATTTTPTPTPTPTIPTGNNPASSNTPISPAPLSAIASISTNSQTFAAPPTFYNNSHSESSYTLLTIPTEINPPQSVSQPILHNHFASSSSTFVPSSPPSKRLEKEWVRTKEKSTIVIIGPCNLGKKFLLNTILSTTYETKRAPTLGRHRSDNNIHAHSSSHPPLSSSSITPGGPTPPINPTRGNSNNVSISVTHNNVRSLFDFELIDPNPPVAQAQAQEIDFEFPLDSSFLNGINWENERRTEMQEIYAMSQYCITKNYTIRDERSFVIPQGVRRYSHTSQLFTITYDRTPQVVVTFLLESDLRLMLWQLHEHYEQGGKRKTLSPSRLDFLHHIYRIAVDVNPPLTGSTILSYLATSAELPLRASVRNMLGKVHRYIGSGRDAMVDRVYVREKIKEVLAKYPYIIKAIEVKVPANVLHGGRKEIVILSDTTAHGHIRSSHIVQSINSADMVLLAVDSNGLTNELASLLVSSRFLTKLTKDPRKIMALDLSEGRVKSRLGNSIKIKDHLIAQFRRLYRDVDSASLRNSLPKILSEMEVLTLKPLLFASLELNHRVPSEHQDKASLQELKNSTGMPLLLERIATLIPSETVKLPIRGVLPISPSISDSKPPISAEQLASSLKHRLHVTDGESAIPNTTTTTTSTTTTTTATAPTTSTSSIPHIPILAPPSTPHATNPLLRSKFEYWKACMLSLITTNECDYEFARRANECSKRAYNDWEQHFRDQFMSNVDNCSTILDPKYNGECLGVNISFLLFHDITSWAPYFWRDSVLARVSALQSEMHEFARRMLEAHAKAIDAKYSTPADSAVRMQQHTLLQYCQTTMEKSITSKFAALFEALKIDVSSIIATICSEVLHSRLLSRSIGIRGLKQYHKLITDAMHVLPYDVAGVIKSKFTEIIKIATQYLDPIEHHMDQLLNSLSSSQNQLKNMDPTMRQYLQQRMFANMRFGNRPGGRPAAATISASLPKSLPQVPTANITRDDVMLDVPNTTNVSNAHNLSASTNNTITFTPIPTARNNSFGSFTNGSNNFGNFVSSGSANSFANPFNHNFHNNTLSNKVNFGTVVSPPKRSDLPVPPHSPPALTTLCIQAISKHINKIHALQSGMLPEELVHQVIAYLISDEMSVYIKQLDSSILGKLLDDSLNVLDFENATSLYPSSCMVIASRCTNLIKLNLTHCINIDDESLHHIASSLKHLEHLTMEGCYQVGDAGVVAIARGCPNLCTINLSGCTRITDISVHNLLVVTTNLQTLILRKCAEISDEAFQGISEKAGNRLLHVDLAECRNISDRTLLKFGQFCAELRILTLAGKTITDDGLRNVVDGCAEIMELELAACDALTSTGIQQCSRLSQLRVLVLSTMRAITDVAFESDNMSDITDAPTKQWPNLQALTLYKCPSLSSKSVSFFAKNCNLLTSIDFSFYTQITDAAVLEIAGACPLQDVDLSSCKDITDAAVVEVARKCSLRKLVVASCGNITDVSLLAVAQNPNLQHLDLTQCERITDDGVVKVAHGCPELRYISLAECNITDASILALGAAVDAQGSGCYHLETVRLAYCREIGNEALHKLARGCPRVHTLDLSNCSARITPEGLRVALRTWTRLQTLRLKGFHLSTESIIDGVHPSLKVLNLSWCRNIEDAVLVDIASACPALEHCDITRCTKITNDAVTKLAEKCSNLRQLNLTGCKDVTQGLVQMLVKIGKMIQR